MSIYTCPHCGAKSFTPISKALAGQLNSSGKVCMECGRKCVNGKGATIFHAVYCLIAFVFVVLVYLKAPLFIDTQYEWIARYEMQIVGGLIISMLVVPRLVNAFFFKLEPAIRVDLK